MFPLGSDWDDVWHSPNSGTLKVPQLAMQSRLWTVPIKCTLIPVNSRAMFTTHSRGMFSSDDRVDVYHINDNHADLAFNKASFLRESWR